MAFIMIWGFTGKSFQQLSSVVRVILQINCSEQFVKVIFEKCKSRERAKLNQCKYCKYAGFNNLKLECRIEKRGWSREIFKQNVHILVFNESSSRVRKSGPLPLAKQSLGQQLVNLGRKSQPFVHGFNKHQRLTMYQLLYLGLGLL